MAPIHHHFEMLGWSETKIILRFWIVAAICAAIGFTLYQQSITLSRVTRRPLPDGPVPRRRAGALGRRGGARCCARTAR